MSWRCDLSATCCMLSLGDEGGPLLMEGEDIDNEPNRTEPKTKRCVCVCVNQPGPFVPFSRMDRVEK